MDRIRLGQIGEQIAEEYLKNKGFKIIARNYRTPRWGEIDRIAIIDDTLVFVEVRTRTSNEFLSPQESITPHKLRSLVQAVNYFLLSNESKNWPSALRIDLVGVTFDKRVMDKPKIEYFQNITM